MIGTATDHKRQITTHIKRNKEGWRLATPTLPGHPQLPMLGVITIWHHITTIEATKIILLHLRPPGCKEVGTNTNRAMKNWRGKG